MGKVVAEISVSLDGFVAGPKPTLEEPLGVGGEQLHEWVVRLKSFKDSHGLPGGGETGPDDELLAEALDATGAVVMGRKMFSGGVGPWEDDPRANGWWGDEPPFHKAVFVLTHHDREPLTLQETTFTFVTDGLDGAIDDARAAAEDQDVLVAGGADTIDQALQAGLLDELRLHLVPVLLGGGARLFAGVGPKLPRLELTEVRESPLVTHLRYRVVK
jgi:dihydrofolate reductase